MVAELRFYATLLVFISLAYFSNVVYRSYASLARPRPLYATEMLHSVTTDL